MDFIERWFGVSPDGGDGSLELFWIIGLVVVIAAFVFRRQIANWLSWRKAGQR